MAQAATVALVLPPVREACPHNLAPTTSTLLQLALGDALAIALLQHKGFTEESFRATKSDVFPQIISDGSKRQMKMCALICPRPWNRTLLSHLISEGKGQLINITTGKQWLSGNGKATLFSNKTIGFSKEFYRVL